MVQSALLAKYPLSKLLSTLRLKGKGVCALAPIAKLPTSTATNSRGTARQAPEDLQKLVGAMITTGCSSRKGGREDKVQLKCKGGVGELQALEDLWRNALAFLCLYTTDVIDLLRIGHPAWYDWDAVPSDVVVRTVIARSIMPAKIFQRTGLKCSGNSCQISTRIRMVTNLQRLYCRLRTTRNQCN